MVNPEHVMGLAYESKNLLSLTIIILVLIIFITLPNAPYTLMNHKSLKQY